MSSIWTIRRSATDAKLMGLCGGIAQRWGVDPTLVRLGAVLLALSGGLGLVLYAAGWLLLPVEGKDRAPVEELLGGQVAKWPRELWIVLIVVACIVVLTTLGPLIPFGAGPAVVLAAIWYFGYYRNRKPKDTAPPASSIPPAAAAPQFYSYPGPASPFTDAANAWQQRIAEHYRAQAAQTRYEPAPPEVAEPGPEPDGPASGLPPIDPPFLAGSRFAPQPPPGQQPAAGPQPGDPDLARADFLASPDPAGIYSEAPVVVTRPTKISRANSRSARRLRLVSLIVLGVTLSALAALDTTGVVAVSLATYFASSLLVLALTLVAAAWLGRARGLLPVSLLVLLGLIASAGAGPIADAKNWESNTASYADTSELPAETTLDAGQLTIDLSHLQVLKATTYRVHLDAGSLTVKVPPAANVLIEAQVDSGLLMDQHNFKAGSDVAQTITQTGPDPKAPQLILQLSVDRGKLEVQR